jgi:hypothetical protein
LQSVLEQFCFQLKVKQCEGVRSGAGLGVVVAGVGVLVCVLGSEGEDEDEEGEGVVFVDGSIR